MSKCFVLAESGIGPGGQIYFRKHKGNNEWYRLFLDNEEIGVVMKDCFGHWSALSNARQSYWFKTRMIEGFATRMTAATFIIKHHGYWMRQERDLEESVARAEKFLVGLKMEKASKIMEGVDNGVI